MVASPLVITNLYVEKIETKMIIKILKEQIPKIVQNLILYLFGTITLVLWRLLPNDIIERVGALLWARLTLALFLIILALSAYILHLRNALKHKINQAEFKFVANPGYHKKIRTGELYCSRCFPDQLSPFAEEVNGWRCTKCKDFIPSKKRHNQPINHDSFYDSYIPTMDD